MTLPRLARWFLGLPHVCPACGEPTRHSHRVKPWAHEAGYWACSTFLTRRDLTRNTTKPAAHALIGRSAPRAQ